LYDEKNLSFTTTGLIHCAR